METPPVRFAAVLVFEGGDAPGRLLVVGVDEQGEQEPDRGAAGDLQPQGRGQDGRAADVQPAVVQRLQQIEVKAYSYTEQWQRLRGLAGDAYGVGSKKVRGVIAQQVYERFPEYVHVGSVSYPTKDFEMEDMYQINKQKISSTFVGRAASLGARSASGACTRARPCAGPRT